MLFLRQLLIKQIDQIYLVKSNKKADWKWSITVNQ